LVDSLELLRDLPYDASVILRQLKRGRAKIEFEHVGLEPLRQTLTSISNRMVLTIVLASLLIASSLIVLSGLPPLVANIPVIGLAGFAISLILAVMLALSMILGK
jgi:ubiquinone biosynthesis protein